MTDPSLRASPAIVGDCARPPAQVPRLRQVTYAHAARTRRGRVLIRSVETLTGRNALLRRMRGLHALDATSPAFWAAIADRFGLALDCPEAELDRIPAEGPVVVVANHPYGILDGLVMGMLLARRRGDFRILANEVFLQAEELAAVTLPVSFDSDRGAQIRNVAMRQTAVAHLRAGGAVGVFPGGAVSSSIRPFGPAADPRWRSFTAKMIGSAEAQVVPVWFEGANSRLFHLATHVHATLRLSLLIAEFRRRADRPVRLRVGPPIPADEIAAIPGGRAALMAELRRRTYALGGQDAAPGWDWEEPRQGCA